MTTAGTRRLLVSFATRPGRGSEGGVGWLFLREGAKWSLKRNDRLTAIIDARDETAVSQELGRLGLAHVVDIVPVQVPRTLVRRIGDSRSRLSYLAWLPYARRAAAHRVMRAPHAVAHQVTFATATLPSVVSPLASTRRIWGPVSVPFAATSTGRIKAPAESSITWALRHFARANARGLDLLITNNGSTSRWFGENRVVEEPNIFLDYQSIDPRDHDPYLLSYCGLLIERKRPWLAIEAIADPRLASYRLQIIGDGPLRQAMQHLARELEVDDRVEFVGQIPHEQSLDRLGSSRLLVHPAAREGSAWVLGEAATCGVASVIFRGSGAESTVLLSNNGSVLVDDLKGSEAAALAGGIARALASPRPAPSSRWLVGRLPGLLDQWWT